MTHHKGVGEMDHAVRDVSDRMFGRECYSGVEEHEGHGHNRSSVSREERLSSGVEGSCKEVPGPHVWNA